MKEKIIIIVIILFSLPLLPITLAATPEEINHWSFVDGDTADGINKDNTKSVDHPQLTVFNEKLYTVWTESFNNINQIRVAVYNNNDNNPYWTFVDGNTDYGRNKDNTKNAGKAQLTVFDEKLYAVWKEDNGTADQIRVAVYSGNNDNPTWSFIDGDSTIGINKDSTKTADSPQLTVFNDKLYAIWKEDNGIAGQVRVAVYNSDDASPVWLFVDGNTVSGINKNNTKTIYAPQLTVFNEKLFAVWKENNATADQVRIAVYNNDDTNPVWALVDGNTVFGINKDYTKNAYYPQLTAFNEKLYAVWRENNSITDQIRVAVYNSDDLNPVWTFVDGNTANGINKDSTKFADTPQLTVFNGKLYATWVENNGTTEQIRVAVYNSDDANPVWTFVDGNTVSGINKDSTKTTDSPQLTVFNEKLYTAWAENNGVAYQTRVTVGQSEAENKETHWACGSLHNHVMISEFKNAAQRIKSLEEAITASRELGFEFIALTEKGAIYDKGTNGKAWQRMVRECNKANTDNFTCFYGQEIATKDGSTTPKGHFAIIGNKIYIPDLSIKKIFSRAHSQNALAIIAHPFYKKDISPLYYYDRWDILNWDAMEIINGVIDDGANQKALAKLYELWNNNIKKSAVAGADLKNININNEEIKNQLQKGYTCVYLNELNRKNIKEAIEKGHGYASSGPQINKFTINNVKMGKTLSVHKNKRLKIIINLKALLKIKKVILIKNGIAIKKFHPNAKEFATEISTRAQKPSWYNLEVYTKEEQAFANAIWVKIKSER